MIINVEKLLEELLAAELPVVGCNSDGRIDFDPVVSPTKGQRNTAQAVLAAHDPTAKTEREQALDAVAPNKWHNIITALETGNATAQQQQQLVLMIAKHLTIS